MLSGSLDAFALPDVFALLSMTKKTGTLRISTGRGEGWLEFRDGDVAYAVSDTRRMALARSAADAKLVVSELIRPGKRVVTSCSSHSLPSVSLNEAYAHVTHLDARETRERGQGPHGRDVQTEAMSLRVVTTQPFEGRSS